MPWRRWKDNLRMDLKEIGINTRNWIGSAQDRDYWREVDFSRSKQKEKNSMYFDFINKLSNFCSSIKVVGTAFLS